MLYTSQTTPEKDQNVDDKKLCRKEAGGELEVYEYDPGELKPQDVEVQVDYCGICHSDLSMIDNEWGFSQYPLVAGHEVIGRVVALGSARRIKVAGRSACRDWLDGA